MARHGDVLIVEVDSVDESKWQPAPKDTRGLVLAEGETSGHFHRVIGRGCKLFHFKDTTNARRLLVTGKAGAELVVVGGESAPGVPRHAPIVLPGGKFEIRVQRTWSFEDEQRNRAVQD
jgi:hypothetical protein